MHDHRSAARIQKKKNILTILMINRFTRPSWRGRIHRGVHTHNNMYFAGVGGIGISFEYIICIVTISCSLAIILLVQKGDQHFVIHLKNDLYAPIIGRCEIIKRLNIYYLR